VPTRNRPDRLARCLLALAAARRWSSFPVYVADSSTDPRLRAEVAGACSPFAFVRLHFHDRAGMGAARNVCARIADAGLLINVDDDIYVHPDAIGRLLARYYAGSGWRVVAGSVAWGEDWSAPVVMRPIGFGRKAEPGEAPDFLIGALLAYPRALALAAPWLEGVPTSDDRMIGAMWRAKGVRLEFAPEARATHDHQHTSYDVARFADHVYAGLFDSLVANRSARSALSWELLGFAAGLKGFARGPRSTAKYLRAWTRGHYLFLRDLRRLARAVEAPLPACTVPEQVAV
jgi:glycosyltransferase involved in cell wall biosynthesis